MPLVHKSLTIIDKLNARSTTLRPEMLRTVRRRYGLPMRIMSIAVLDPTVALMRAHPKAWRAIYNKVVLLPGYAYVSSGAEHTVIAHGDSVLKVDRGSQMLDDARRRLRVHERERLFGVAKHYLPNYLLPQTVQAEYAPFRHRPPAVITRQPLLRPTVPDLVYETPDQISQQLAAGSIPLSKVKDGLAELLAGSQRMYEQEGLLPDFGGIGNLVVEEDGGLKLVDSYMTTPELRSAVSLREGFTTVGQEHEALVGRLQRFCEVA